MDYVINATRKIQNSRHILKNLDTPIVKLNTTDITCNLLKPDHQFPDDLFTLEERKSGAIGLHILAFIYSIVLADHVCNEYLIPSLSYLSFGKLRLSWHVASITLLAGGSSLTQLFTGISGVFLARNDLSFNILVGTGSFNLLVIVGLCCFYIYKLEFKLNLYPIFRNSFFYLINLSLKLLFLYKNNFNKLYWYDSLIEICFFYIFMLINLFDNRLMKSIKDFYSFIINKFRSKSFDDADIEMNDENVNDLNAIKKVKFLTVENPKCSKKVKEPELNLDKSSSDLTISSKSGTDSEIYEEPYDLVHNYKNFSKKNNFIKFKLCFTLPAHIIAFLIVLDFRRFENHKNIILSITILSSCLVIGFCSYSLMWMSLTICETLDISETLYGFIIISTAISIKDTIKLISICKLELDKFRSNRSMIKNNKNKLNMIVTNCISNNIFNLSIALGIPYLLNSLFFSNGNFFSHIYNGGNIFFLLAGLICCLVLFLILLMLSTFRLTRNFGLSILIIWLIYTSLVILIELDLISLFKIDNEIKTC